MYHLCTQGSISLGIHEKNEDFGAVLVSPAKVTDGDVFITLLHAELSASTIYDGCQRLVEKCV